MFPLLLALSVYNGLLAVCELLLFILKSEFAKFDEKYRHVVDIDMFIILIPILMGVGSLFMILVPDPTIAVPFFDITIIFSIILVLLVEFLWVSINIITGIKRIIEFQKKKKQR